LFTSIINTNLEGYLLNKCDFQRPACSDTHHIVRTQHTVT